MHKTSNMLASKTKKGLCRAKLLGWEVQYGLFTLPYYNYKSLYESKTWVPCLGQDGIDLDGMGWWKPRKEVMWPGVHGAQMSSRCQKTQGENCPWEFPEEMPFYQDINSILGILVSITMPHYNSVLWFYPISLWWCFTASTGTQHTFLYPEMLSCCNTHLKS